MQYNKIELTEKQNLELFKFIHLSRILFLKFVSSLYSYVDILHVNSS